MLTVETVEIQSKKRIFKINTNQNQLSLWGGAKCNKTSDGATTKQKKTLFVA